MANESSENRQRRVAAATRQALTDQIAEYERLNGLARETIRIASPTHSAKLIGKLREQIAARDEAIQQMRDQLNG